MSLIYGCKGMENLMQQSCKGLNPYTRRKDWAQNLHATTRTDWQDIKLATP